MRCPPDVARGTFPDLVDHPDSTHILDPNLHLLIVITKTMSTDATSAGKPVSPTYVPFVASRRVQLNVILGKAK